MLRNRLALLWWWLLLAAMGLASTAIAAGDPEYFNLCEDTSYLHIPRVGEWIPSLNRNATLDDADIYDALVEACSFARTDFDRKIVIPNGVYSLGTANAETPYREGFYLHGAGACLDYPINSSLGGRGTTIVYTGTQGGAMLRLRGTQCSIGDFALQGYNPGDDVDFTDGVLSSDGLTLTSATAAFVSSGCVAGNQVRINNNGTGGNAQWGIFRVTSVDSETQLTLDRSAVRSSGTGETAINCTVRTTCDQALLVTLDGQSGIGTGKMRLAPMKIYNAKYALQLGESATQGNCDNITVEWLDAEECDAAFRTVTEQAMDTVICRLFQRRSRYALQLDGAGEVWVQKLLALGDNASAGNANDNWMPMTGLRIPSTSRIGSGNGQVRISNVKVDAHSEHRWCAVDSEVLSSADILFDNGRYSYTTADSSNAQGTEGGFFARVTATNKLTFQNWSATFTKLQADSAAYSGATRTPQIVLRDCRCWNGTTPSNIFVTGKEGNYKIHDCISGAATQYADVPAVTTEDVATIAQDAAEAHVEALGYQTATDVATAIASYGYQTAAQVTAAVEAYGYQTATEVADALASALDGATIVTMSRSDTAPKENQASRWSFPAGVAAVPGARGLTTADIEWVEVVWKKNYSNGEVYRKRSSTSSAVTLNGDGSGFYDLAYEDYVPGGGKLTAGRYYVIFQVKLAGIDDPIEVDQESRVRIAHDQD